MHRHFDRVDTRIFNYGLIGMVRWEQPRPPCIKGQGTLRHDAMMSSTEFWRLIDRLGIPDTDALNLIGYPGKPPASGRRPRFRLTMRQTRTANALAKGGRLRRSGKHQHGCASRTGLRRSQAARRWRSWLRAMMRASARSCGSLSGSCLGDRLLSSSWRWCTPPRKV
jgi:hypothetical protein